MNRDSASFCRARVSKACSINIHLEHSAAINGQCMIDSEHDVPNHVVADQDCEIVALKEGILLVLVTS